MNNQSIFSALPSHAMPISGVIDAIGSTLGRKTGSSPAQPAPTNAARVNPWTSVGRGFVPTSNADEALERSGLNWAVEKIGLRTSDLAPVPDQFAIRRSDTSQVLGIIGPEYVPLQNAAAFGFFRDLAGCGPISFESAGEFDGGRIVWVQARLPDLQIRLGDDISETMLFISTGHIGNKPLVVAPTTFRIACKNSLRLAEAEHAAERRREPRLEVGWTVRHTRGMSHALADIQTAYARTRRSHAVTVQAFEYLASKPMTDRLATAFFTKVFDGVGLDESERAQTIAKNRRERLAAILAGPTSQVAGTRGTCFALLNAATEFIEHDRTTRTDDGNADAARLLSATFGSGAMLKEKAWSTIMALVHA
jgi:phage/plasmid-like protein (TIGR03299 family)